MSTLYIIFFGSLIFLTLAVFLFKHQYKYIFLNFLLLYIGFSILSYQFIINKKEFHILLDKREFLNDKDLRFLPAHFLQKDDGREKNDIIKFEKNDLSPIEFPLSSNPDGDVLFCVEDNIVYEKLDKFGFRNDNQIYNEKFHDIALIGDSFGAVECIPNIAQDFFSDKNLKIINLSSGSNGPLINYAITKEYLKYYNARYIYHIISANDYTRNIYSAYDIDITRELNNATLKKYLIDKNFYQDYFLEENLKNYKIFTKKLSKKYKEEYKINLNHLYNIISGYNTVLYFKQYIESNFKVEKKEKYKLKFVSKKDYEDLKILNKKFSNINKGNIINVIIPNKDCINYLNFEQQTDYLLKEILVNTNKILDLRDKLCKDEFFANLLFSKGGHFNQRGYLKLFESLEKDFYNRSLNIKKIRKQKNK